MRLNTDLRDSGIEDLLFIYDYWSNAHRRTGARFFPLRVQLHEFQPGNSRYPASLTALP